ncbi:MAG TPA: SAM-dependent methyltransferase, partial [Streptosporangiaceae bacterium]
IVMSHVTGEGRDDDALRQITGTYDLATAPLVMRTREEISRFFEGLELVEPGMVFLSQWRPAIHYYAGGGTRWAYAGVGMKASGEESDTKRLEVVPS